MSAQIMIVEDERIIAMDIRARLVKLGYQVSAVVASGADALEKAQAARPDLVLMDIRLEGAMDGVETADQLRLRFGVPIIYLTAYADEDTLRRAKLTEAYGYLLKPFEERDMRSTIEIALYKHAMEQKLKESERWLATILKSIGDGVIATNATGYIQLMNPVAEQLTGCTQAEALGQHITRVLIVIDQESGQLLESPVLQAVRDCRTVNLGGHCSLLRPDGTAVPIDDSAAPLLDDAGRPIGAVMVFRDVTARRRVEESLARYTRDLEERNAELDAFGDAVAHGLKQPLTQLTRQAQDLADRHPGLAGEIMTDHLRIMAWRGQAMMRIIDDLLLLAQVRTAEIDLCVVNMQTIVAAAQRRLAGVLKQSQGWIVSPPSWPAAIGYGPWLEDVWVRLLTSALEQCGDRPAPITLSAGLSVNGAVRFGIRGRGHLADAKAPDPGSLNLVLVKRIVERMGGQARLDGGGTSGEDYLLSFTLPAAG